ncbi:hypothetical protein Cgig2_029807 [Carnegiea gigantea]|uniref:Uncharacterized protein n=1 Tax=Carnegiea gigantea TaxID=171969 RepID=A0A9Q1KLB7_9CARY|nr:hypothetical protein Cgig2_029807 [Carnegiea gigantea]
MEVEITNPIEIQDKDDEEIPLVRDDIKLDIVDADIVDANLVDANFITIIMIKMMRMWKQNPNVTPFAKITPDMERVVGKNVNHFIGECSKWVKEFCPLNSRHNEICLQKPMELMSPMHWNYNVCYCLEAGDGSLDPGAAIKYEEFKELHTSQIEKEGANNLSLKEAHPLVMKEKPSYHRGLGPSPQPHRKGRGQSTEVRSKSPLKSNNCSKKRLLCKVKSGSFNQPTQSSKLKLSK